MQVKIKALELASSEYFSIRHESIGRCSRTDAVNILWIKLEETGLRLVLMIPPVGFCWGMQFGHAKELATWSENIIADSFVAKTFRARFDDLGIDPADIPETLAGCSWFGESQELTIGVREPDVPRAWFRTVFVPDNEHAFEDFLYRVKMHIEQLGVFFMLPEPEVDQLELLTWAESVDAKFELLFGTDHRRSIFSDTFNLKRSALSNAIERIAEGDARKLLTPRFLEWDLVRPNYPVPETELRSKKGRTFVSAFSLRSQENVNEEIKVLALLQIQLMQKWNWPVGLQMLARHRDSQEYGEAILKGRPAWQPLEIEVAKLLNQTQNIYPIIFE